MKERKKYTSFISGSTNILCSFQFDVHASLMQRLIAASDDNSPHGIFDIMKQISDPLMGLIKNGLLIPDNVEISINYCIFCCRPLKQLVKITTPMPFYSKLYYEMRSHQMSNITD